MKASLIAVSKLTKNIPAENYAHANDITRNPVYVTFSKDYQSVLSLLKRKRDEKAYAKLSSSVIALWRDFEERLDKGFISDKISELTNILMQEKEYEIASNQCIDRLLLRHFHPVNKFVFASFEEVVDLLHNFNLQDSHCSYLMEALVKKHVCSYERLLMADPMLTRLCSMPSLLSVLKSLCYLLQLLLVNPCYQWLLFNVSIHVYKICRHVMPLGFSPMVLDQLKWCVDWTGMRVPQCMAVDQLTTHLVPDHAIVSVINPGKEVEVMDVEEFCWRMQLGAALVQCYYDCCQDECAETWARKMVVELTNFRERLMRVDELLTSKPLLLRELVHKRGLTVSNVDGMGGGSGCWRQSGNGGDGKGSVSCGGFMVHTGLQGEADLECIRQQLLTSFKSHSIKFSTLIFKRAVFQSRRRPQGFLPPQNRFHANQLTNVPWPRSQTERLLEMLFEGSSAQFLAILTCLHGVCRRSCLQVFKLETDEIELLDVYEELFFAAQEIISGGGGDRRKGVVGGLSCAGSMLKGLVEGRGEMFCMALRGMNGVCVKEVVEFVKIAYNNNQRSIISVFLSKLIDVLEKQADCAYLGDLLELKVIKLVDKLTEMRGIKQDSVSDPVLYPGIETYVLELLQCVEELIPLNGDHDMILDGVLLAWKKLHCFLQPPRSLIALVTPWKAGTEETMTAKLLKFFEANPNQKKWLEVMEVLKRVLGGCLGGGWMGVHFPEALLHTTTLLGLLYEVMSMYQPEDAGLKHNFKCPNDTAIEMLARARASFEEGILAIECLHDILSCNLDHYAKHLNHYLRVEPVDTCSQNPVKEECEEVQKLRRLLEEMQPILTTLHLRTLTKLSHFSAHAVTDCKEANLKDFQPPQVDKHAVKTSNAAADALLCGSKNRMSQALCQAVQTVVQQACCLSLQGKETAMTLLDKMAKEEWTFLHQHNIPPPSPQCPLNTPPTLSFPILIHKTNHSLVFRPPLFFHSCLAFFKLFGCLATPAKRNKAGYLDTELEGCGTLVSATADTVFRVCKLLPGQRYVFACAACDLKGEMIGKVGVSTKAILTSNPASFSLASSIISHYTMESQPA